MKPATGRWVSGDDFFDRELELQEFASRIKNRNHVLLTDQRCMGKTRLARQCDQQLEAQGWHAAFADVEGAKCPEDAIAEIARSLQSILPIWSRFTAWKDRLFRRSFEELGTPQFRLNDAIQILEHDGYLESSDGSYRFQSRLLKDWWSARFSGYQPLNRWKVINEQKGNKS